ncbi:Uncharacterised protein [Klebsiella pneumoniae]|nr:Uncharacterised protein [Klebsiella pneumoniae]
MTVRARRESASAGTARPRRRRSAATAVRSARHAAARSAAALRQPAPHSGGSPPTSALRHRRVRCPGAAAGNGRRAARPGRPGESPLAGQERAGVVVPAVQWAPPATAGAPPAGWRHRRAGRPASRKRPPPAPPSRCRRTVRRSTPGAPAAHPGEPPAAPPIRPGPVRRVPPATRPASDRRAIRRTPAGSVRRPPAKRRGQSPAPAAAVPAGAAPALRRRRAATAAAADSRLARAPAGRRRHAAPASPARPVPAALAAIAGNCRRDSGRHGIRAGPAGTHRSPRPGCRGARQRNAAGGVRRAGRGPALRRSGSARRSSAPGIRPRVLRARAVAHRCPARGGRACRSAVPDRRQGAPPSPRRNSRWSCPGCWR